MLLTSALTLSRVRTKRDIAKAGVSHILGTPLVSVPFIELKMMHTNYIRSTLRLRL
jgi:hypothetical protein